MDSDDGPALAVGLLIAAVVVNIALLTAGVAIGTWMGRRHK